MREIDEKAVQAMQNQECFDTFITEQQFFILKCASKFANRYITKNDDEWAIALTAFSEAIKSYDEKGGSFLSFAELVIKRRLTDELRKQSRHKAEILVDPYTFSSEPEEDEENTFVKAEVVGKLASQPDVSLKEEIESVTAQLAPYGFSFYDLISCSPKAGKTKAACAKAVNYMAENPILCKEMEVSKNLPIKIIQNNTLIPRKILERHRKYIIAAVKIITGDYPYLAEYMRSFREAQKE